LVKSIFKPEISDEIKTRNALTKEQAIEVFNYFQDSKLFRWQDSNNDCEDRANAICLLLDKWNIPNAKAWIFSGYMFNKKGFLKNMWKYHVAVILPARENEEIVLYALDPATNPELIPIRDWAENVGDNPFNYYVVKNGKYYIFDPGNIKKKIWSKRNKGNFNWTMQGLSGINGLSVRGKAQLAFNKKKVIKTKALFMQLMEQRFSFT
jgi:Glutaminase